MAVLHIRKPWTQKPDGLIEVNERSFFADKLLSVCVFDAGGFEDLWNGAQSTRRGATNPTEYLFEDGGVGRRYGTSDGYDDTPVIFDLVSMSALTLFGRIEFPTSAPGGSLRSPITYASGTETIQFYASGSTLSFSVSPGGTRTVSSSVPIRQTFNAFGWFGTDNLAHIRVDGGADLTDPSPNASDFGSNGWIARAGRVGTTASPADYATQLALLWEGEFTIDEQDGFLENPWQVVSRRVQRIYSLPASGSPSLSNARAFNLAATTGDVGVTLTF